MWMEKKLSSYFRWLFFLPLLLVSFIYIYIYVKIYVFSFWNEFFFLFISRFLSRRTPDVIKIRQGCVQGLEVEWMLRRPGGTSAALLPTASVCLTMLLIHSFQEALDQSGFHVSPKSWLVPLGAEGEHPVTLFECVLYSFMRWLVGYSHKSGHGRGSGKQSLLYLTGMRERESHHIQWGGQVVGVPREAAQPSSWRTENERERGLKGECLYWGGQGGVHKQKYEGISLVSLNVTRS